MKLLHYGIQGQKWGVRHGPPYPIDYYENETRISKGTKFNRVSKYDESVSKGHAYVTYLNEDNERYKGFFAATLKLADRKSNLYSISLESKEEMISPSKKKRIETFIELYSNDPEIARRLATYHKQEEWNSVTPFSQKYYDKKFSNLSDDELTSLGYKTFVKAIGGDEYIRGVYFNKLSEEGYNFVQDDMDSGYLGKAPSIIFDREKSLSYKGQKELSNKEIMTNKYTYNMLVDKKYRK